MPRLPRKAYAELSLDDIRALIKQHKEEGLKLASHLKKMQEYYEEWEDDLKYLDDIINEANADNGITREQLEEPMELEDLYDSLTGVTDIIKGESDESILDALE